MEKTHIKEDLINNAEQIQRVLEDFTQILRVLEYATYCFRENQEKCRAIGVEGDEPYASQLETALREATEYSNHLSSVLKKSSAEYVAAIKSCGLPMSPAFPELWDRLTDKNL